jgi:hypothetical protein
MALASQLRSNEFFILKAAIIMPQYADRHTAQGSADLNAPNLRTWNGKDALYAVDGPMPSNEKS